MRKKFNRPFIKTPIATYFPVITLTTDFGWSDPYVASLHGVILSIHPRALIVDNTHDIPSYDIGRAAFVVGSVFQFFPEKTIHVCVVDPGVGGKRKPILVQSENYFFVGPDNGVFSLIESREKIKAIYHLTAQNFFRKELSSTFHGRDLFAPVAAHLSRGVSVHRFGKKIKAMTRLPLLSFSKHQNKIRGFILAIDKFGNAITNIPSSELKNPNHFSSMSVGAHQIHLFTQTYSSTKVGTRPMVVAGSHGFLEMALYEKNLARHWRLKQRDSVILNLK